MEDVTAISTDRQLKGMPQINAAFGTERTTILTFFYSSILQLAGSRSNERTIVRARAKHI